MITPLKRQNQSERERAHLEKLEKAFKTPGIRESMEVLNGNGFESYRLITNQAYNAWTSNNTKLGSFKFG